VRGKTNREGTIKDSNQRKGSGREQEPELVAGPLPQASLLGGVQRMSLLDWTFETYLHFTGDIAQYSLDPDTKIEGNSSLKIYVSGGGATGGPHVKATRKNFSATSVQVVLYARTDNTGTVLYKRVGHPSYGDFELPFSAANTWDRFRLTFWYDISTDTKFVRVERWDPNTNSWVKQGDDRNAGTGAPTAGSIYLYVETRYTSGNTWFDDIYVYTV
jgi:hypothetical protein